MGDEPSSFIISAEADGCPYNIFMTKQGENYSTETDFNKKCKSNSVNKILRNSDGSYAVICQDDSYGTITFPTSSICASGNGRSDCKPFSNWSKERAASFICN